MPSEYRDYVLCKLLHCLPSQLADEDDETVQLYLEFYGVERQHEQAQREAARTKGNKS